MQKKKSVPTDYSAKEGSILEAYLEVAAKEGVERVTLQKVAKAANVPYSSVHYYFGSEDRDILHMALCYVAAASEQFMADRIHAASLNPKVNGLKAYIDAKFEWGRKFPTYASIFCYFIYQAGRDAKFRIWNTQLRHAGHAQLRSLILQEIGKGRYTATKYLDELIDSMQLMLAGGILNELTTEPPRIDPKAVVVKLVDQYLVPHKKNDKG